jgi:hypothetical protein
MTANSQLALRRSTSAPSQMLTLFAECSGMPGWTGILAAIAQDKRHDLPDHTLLLWKAKLERFPDEDVASVLLEGTWKFFPSVDEVIADLEAIADVRRLKRDQERQEADREDTAAARDSWQDPEKAKWLEQQAADLARKLSLRNPLAAARPFIIARSRPVPPGIVLTAEQISERREKERQEIAALKEAGEWNGEEVPLRKHPKPLPADAGEQLKQVQKSARLK